MSSGFHRLGMSSHPVPGFNLLVPSVSLQALDRAPADPLRSGVATRKDAKLAPATGISLAQVQSPASPREMGYTGNSCPTCSSTRMLFTGKCETCQECGSNSSCG